MSGWPTTPTGMIRELVSFDTTSSRSNLALIQFVEEYLRSHGIQSRRVADDSGGKANLFATVGPPVAGGVVLSGHTDVVPVAGRIGTRIRSWSWNAPADCTGAEPPI